MGLGGEPTRKGDLGDAHPQQCDGANGRERCPPPTQALGPPPKLKSILPLQTPGYPHPPPRGVNLDFAPPFHPLFSLTSCSRSISPPGQQQQHPQDKDTSPPKIRRAPGAAAFAGPPPGHAGRSPGLSPPLLAGPGSAVPSYRLGSPPLRPASPHQPHSLAPGSVPVAPDPARSQAPGLDAGPGGGWGLLFAFIYCCVSWPSRIALMKTRPEEKAAPRLPPPGTAAAAGPAAAPPEPGSPRCPGVPPAASAPSPGGETGRGGNETLRAHEREERRLITSKITFKR